jgi:hypothetical protein
MLVTGAIRIDLRVDDEHDVKRAIQNAAYSPAGAEVEFLVAPHQWPGWEGITFLRAHGDHLGRIRINCSDPETVRIWVMAIRGEDAA